MTYPLILSPESLAAAIADDSGDDGLLVVDLCKPEVYAAGHVPGAVHLDYAQIVARSGHAAGLLPDEEHLGRVLSALGLRPAHHVVAYDDEGGGKAGRLLWTLDVLGHGGLSLLDGGLHAWANEGHRLETEPRRAEPSEYRARIGEAARADKAWILERLGRADVVLLDTRTPEEYHGTNVRAARGGHIPGAVNFNWTDAMDLARNLRLKPADELREALRALGVTPDKEVVAYCQTHHRSSHTYVVLRSLGFDRVRGYPGAWSEWGNDPDTPVET